MIPHMPIIIALREAETGGSLEFTGHQLQLRYDTSSRFSKKPYLNGTRQSMLERHLLRLLGTLKHTDTYTYIHLAQIHTHTN